MDHEEYLGEDAYDDSDITSEHSVSLNSFMKEQYLVMKQIKKNDPDYYSYKHTVDGELKKVELYSTSSNKDSFIRHAISGTKSGDRTGSNKENLYFKVVDTTLPKNKISDGPRHLYYYSPEEFERHQNTTVSQDLKEDWMIKNLRANRIYSK